jgi:hypothetical protein
MGAWHTNVLDNVKSPGPITNSSDAFGGAYHEETLSFVLGSEGTPIELAFKSYTGLDGVSFVHRYPKGANATAARGKVPPSIGVFNATAGKWSMPQFCDPKYHPQIAADDIRQDTRVPAGVSFPAFSVKRNVSEFGDTSLYSAGELGWLTWCGTFSIPRWGDSPLNSRPPQAKPALNVFQNDYCQLAGGPIVLFKKGEPQGPAIVISAVDNFMTSTITNFSGVPNSAAAAGGGGGGGSGSGLGATVWEQEALQEAWRMGTAADVKAFPPGTCTCTCSYMYV